MPAVISTALKKLSVTILSDKRGWQAVFTILFAVILLVAFPIIVLINVLNSDDIDVGSDSFNQKVMDSLSDEQTQNAQFVNDINAQIETQMTEKGLESQVNSAQILFVFFLYDKAKENTDFVTKLVGCYTLGRTNEELINNVNTIFGTQILIQDYENILNLESVEDINENNSNNN